MKKLKRVAALVLSLVMLIGLMPTNVYADTEYLDINGIFAVDIEYGCSVPSVSTVGSKVVASQKWMYNSSEVTKFDKGGVFALEFTVDYTDDSYNVNSVPRLWGNEFEKETSKEALDYGKESQNYKGFYYDATSKILYLVATFKIDGPLYYVYADKTSDIAGNSVLLHFYGEKVGSGLTYQWEKAEASDADAFEAIDSETTDSLTLTGLSSDEDGDRYRCKVTNSNSDVYFTEPVTLLKGIGNTLNSSTMLLSNYPTSYIKSKNPANWYISNGQLAYTFMAGIGSDSYGLDNYSFEVIGKANGKWCSTSYNYAWEICTTEETEPSAVKIYSDTAPGHYDTNLNNVDIKMYFDKNNSFALNFDISLLNEKKSIAFGTDTFFIADNCVISAIKRNGVFKQSQIVGVTELINAALDTPAFVVRYDTEPDYVFVGNFSTRGLYTNSDTLEVEGTDSGMETSYVNKQNIKFSFLIGTVEETGAVAPCTTITSKDSVTVQDSLKSMYYAIFNEDGTELIKDWTLGLGTSTSDHRDLVFTGLVPDTKYTIKAVAVNRFNGGEPSSDDVEESIGITKLDLESPWNKEGIEKQPKVIVKPDSITIENFNENLSYVLLDKDGNEVPCKTDELLLEEGDVLLLQDTSSDPTTYSWLKLKPGNYKISVNSATNDGLLEVIVSTQSSKKYKASTEDGSEKISGTGKKGSTRTIYPDENKEVKNVIVKDKNGNIISVTENEDGTYSFKQPASDVTVEIVYADEKLSLEDEVIAALLTDEVKKANSETKAQINPGAKFINGYEDGTFVPNKEVSNIELMSMVTELFTDSAKANGEKLDLNQGDNAWADDIISKANKLGLVPGNKDDENYNLGEFVTRGDMAKVIYNMIKDTTKTLDLKNIDTCQDAIGKDYEDAVSKLIDLGILKGCDDGLFHGEKTLTRAEAVVIINRTLRSLGLELKVSDIKKTFPDLLPSHWAYYEILFAANK